MVGMESAGTWRQVKDEVDVNTLIATLQATLKGDKTMLTDAERLSVRQEFMQKLQARQTAKTAEDAKKNQTEGDAFLAKNKTKPGVKETASGLQYEVVKQGSGPKPKATDTVKVEYTGTKIDGTKFDSSVDHGQSGHVPAQRRDPGLDRRHAAHDRRFRVQVLRAGQACLRRERAAADRPECDPDLRRQADQHRAAGCPRPGGRKPVKVIVRDPVATFNREGRGAIRAFLLLRPGALRIRRAAEGIIRGLEPGSA